MLSHCAAVTAAPGVYFAKELVEAYPEAKVILVERDIESWAKSFDIILSGAFNPRAPVFQLLDSLWGGQFVGIMRSFPEYYYGATNAKEARANLRDVHRRHNELVRSLVRKERLVLFDLAVAGSRCPPSLARRFLKPRFHMPTMPLRQRRSAFLVKETMLRSLRKLTFVVGPVAVAAFAVFLEL